MAMNSPEASPKCVPQETVIKNVELAHAYVPFQKLCGTFSPLAALAHGTAFPPLYDPYTCDKRKAVCCDE